MSEKFNEAAILIEAVNNICQAHINNSFVLTKENSKKVDELMLQLIDAYGIKVNNQSKQKGNDNEN